MISTFLIYISEIISMKILCTVTGKEKSAPVKWNIISNLTIFGPSTNLIQDAGNKKIYMKNNAFLGTEKI